MGIFLQRLRIPAICPLCSRYPGKLVVSFSSSPRPKNPGQSCCCKSQSKDAALRTENGGQERGGRSECPGLKRGRICLSSTLLFYLGPQSVDGCPPTLVRADSYLIY